MSKKFITFGFILSLTLNIYGLSRLYRFNLRDAVCQKNTTAAVLDRCDQNLSNPLLTFDRRSHCNIHSSSSCYATNKSLLMTFWDRKSVDKWLPQNILSAFPSHSFDHMIFVHDNSSWHTHPGYDRFIWIHVQGQLRFWYVKRFALPSMVQSYQYIWILDDDARLNFDPLQYQCVVKSLKIPLSAAGRLRGAIIHPITRVDDGYKDRIGRWTDFVEVGPMFVATSAAWQCILRYIDPSTGSGYGVDTIWCKMIAEQCFPQSDASKVCAILDAFSVDHQSNTINSGAYGMPELAVYEKYNKKWNTAMHTYGPLASNQSLFKACLR